MNYIKLEDAVKAVRSVPAGTPCRGLAIEKALLAIPVERNDALALQADEWEGKYQIVSDMNASLRKQLEDARDNALEEAAVRVGELFGIDNHVCDAIRLLKGKS